MSLADWANNAKNSPANQLIQQSDTRAGRPLTAQERQRLVDFMVTPLGFGFGDMALNDPASAAAIRAQAEGYDDQTLLNQAITRAQIKPDSDAFTDFIAPILAGGMVGGAALGLGGAGTEAAAGGTAAAEGGGAAAAGGGTTAAGAAAATMPAAVPETAATLANWGMVETAPGVFEALNAPATLGGAAGGAAATAGGSAISRILNGTAGPEDYIDVLGRAAPGLIGAYAANKQADAYSDAANKYFAVGAPSRARFESSFAPGFSMANEPGYADALNQTTKATLHGLSVNGNPADSPNAWMQTLSDVNSKFAYPALQDYRRLNAGSGGLAALTSAAPGAESSAIRSQGDVYNALGGAAADVFNPPRSLSDLLREVRRAGY